MVPSYSYLYPFSPPPAIEFRDETREQLEIYFEKVVLKIGQEIVFSILFQNEFENGNFIIKKRLSDKTWSAEIRDFHCRSQFFTQKKNRSNASIEISRVYRGVYSLRICMEIL